MTGKAEYCAHRGCSRRAVQQTRDGMFCKRHADRLPPHLRRVEPRRKTTPAPAADRGGPS